MKISQEDVAQVMIANGGARGHWGAPGGCRWHSVADVIYAVEQRNQTRHKEMCIQQRWNYRNDAGFANVKTRSAMNTSCLHQPQREALMKIFEGNGMNSGLIEMECGTGKTLVGVHATHISGAPTLINMVNSVSVDQWEATYRDSGYNAQDVFVIKRSNINKWDFQKGLPAVTICTYTLLLTLMKTYEELFMQDTPQHDHSKQMDIFSMIFVCMLLNTSIGVHVLDEVHVAPAQNWQLVLRVRSKCRIGLSGTLVREDDGILELTSNKIGPVLYSYKRSTMFHVNYEVTTVPNYTSKWWSAQIAAEKDENKKRALQNILIATNPYKIQHVVKRIHALAAGAKVIIFCDVHGAIALWHSMLQTKLDLQKCKLLGPLSGKSTHNERQAVVEEMRTSKETCAVLCSKIFDASIDIPTCRHVMQVALCTRGRQQEEQRLGRTRRTDTSISYMYTIATESEMHYVNPRLEHLKSRYNVKLEYLPLEENVNMRCAVLDSFHEANGFILDNSRMLEGFEQRTEEVGDMDAAADEEDDELVSVRVDEGRYKRHRLLMPTSSEPHVDDDELHHCDKSGHTFSDENEPNENGVDEDEVDEEFSTHNAEQLQFIASTSALRKLGHSH